MIDADNGQRDGARRHGFELLRLLSQIADHAVDLLNHGRRKNLDLYPDSNICCTSTRHGKPGFSQWFATDDALTKRSIAATYDLSCDPVLRVYDEIGGIDALCKRR